MNARRGELLHFSPTPLNLKFSRQSTLHQHPIRLLRSSRHSATTTMLDSTMRETRRLAFTSLLILAPSTVWARTWQDVVDPTIYLASAIDMGRLESALEKDPFDFRPQPTASPTYKVEESGSSPTSLPSLAPTQADTSSSPTTSPTARYEFVVGNGGCPTGLTLFEIRFVDSWGDGWGRYA